MWIKKGHALINLALITEIIQVRADSSVVFYCNNNLLDTFYYASSEEASYAFKRIALIVNPVDIEV